MITNDASIKNVHLLEVSGLIYALMTQGRKRPRSAQPVSSLKQERFVEAPWTSSKACNWSSGGPTAPPTRTETQTVHAEKEGKGGRKEITLQNCHCFHFSFR